MSGTQSSTTFVEAGAQGRFSGSNGIPHPPVMAVILLKSLTVTIPS